MAAKDLNTNKLQSISGRILIVESDRFLVKLIRNYLQNGGATDVECVGDGEEAKNCVTTKSYDLIFIDWKLKNPTGLDLYLMIRDGATSGSTPVILMSGFVTKNDLQIVQMDTNAKFLVKPFTEEILLSYVRNTLKKSKASSEAAENLQPNMVEPKIPSAGTGIIIAKGEGSNSGLDLHNLNGSVATASNEVQKGDPNGKVFSASQGRQGLGTDISGAFSRAAQNEGQDIKSSHGDASGQAYDGTFGRDKSTQPLGAMGIVENKSSVPAPHGESIAEKIVGPMSGSSGHGSGSQFGMNAAFDRNIGTESGMRGPSAKNIGVESGAPGGAKRKFIESSGESRVLDVDSSNEQINRELEIDRPESELEAHRIVLSTESVLGKRIEIYVPKKALIADQDEALRTLIANYLGELGTSRFDYAHNGETAWELINGNDYDIILFDWRLKGVSGINLYNRIRSKRGSKSTPLMVLSGFSDKEDFRILGESSYSKVVSKPLNIDVFDEVLRSTLRDARVHSAIDEAMSRMFEPILNDAAAMATLLKHFAEKVSRPLVYLVAAGEYFVAQGRTLEAESAFGAALRVDSSNVVAMTELSKIYHRSNRSHLAIRFLAKANVLSPENVERLCVMGEVGLNLQDPGQAKKYFEKALKVDQQNEKAQAGVLVAANMSEYLARATLDPGTTVDSEKSSTFSLAASLNAVGITYIKNKQMDRARDQYKAAMNFIHDSPTMSKLQFNLGMAFFREKNYKDAYYWFDLARTYGGSEFEKAHTYAAKMEQILGIGQKSPDDLSNLVPPEIAAKAVDGSALARGVEAQLAGTNPKRGTAQSSQTIVYDKKKRRF